MYFASAMINGGKTNTNKNKSNKLILNIYVFELLISIRLLLIYKIFKKTKFNIILTEQSHMQVLADQLFLSQNI